MKGHILITDKVCFVPDELPKPDRKNFMKRYGKGHESLALYTEKMKAYEASKRTVEVSNVYFSESIDAWLLRGHISHKLIVKNNQKCDAEVADNKAIITKLY